jgi:NTP pyrophosphatase (non-canonical NTP hydrolase)
MNIDEYQQLANRTLIDKPDFQITDAQIMLAWNAIGLAGEAGECADAIKKHVFHQQPLDTNKACNELGDVLWYVAALCKCLNITLSEVMAANIEKLKARYPKGYSAARSANREGLAS